MKRFFESANYDRNYDEGVFFIRAVENNDQALLRKLINGNTNADPQCSITRHSAYHRGPEIKAYTNEQIKKDRL